MAQSPTLVPIYYEASGGVYETRFPTKFGRPGVYWADFTHVPGQDEHSETASRQYYDTYLKCRDVYDSLVRLEDFIKVFIEREAAPVKEKAPFLIFLAVPDMFDCLVFASWVLCFTNKKEGVRPPSFFH